MKSKKHGTLWAYKNAEVHKFEHSKSGTVLFWRNITFLNVVPEYLQHPHMKSKSFSVYLLKDLHK